LGMRQPNKIVGALDCHNLFLEHPLRGKLAGCLIVFLGKLNQLIPDKPYRPSVLLENGNLRFVGIESEPE